jgi:glycosyltransferase involved in cell wall biosynthesis
VGKLGAEAAMRILAYTDVYAQKTVTFITNELKQNDLENDLLLIYSKRLYPDLYILKNMKEIPYRYGKVLNKLRWWLEQSQAGYYLRNHSFSSSLNKAVSEFRPDIIHCHFGTDFLKLFSNLTEENKKIPVLISFYGFDVTEKIRNKAILKKYRRSLSLPNVHSVTVSGSLAGNVNKIIKPANKAKVLHSGIDTDFFVRKETKKNPDEFIFLQVSSFLEKKGHKYTLDAFKIFIEKNKKFRYKFILAGLGPLESQVLSYIREKGLENHVEFIGVVSPSQMVEWGSKVNCFVQMSITASNGDQEGLPNVLLEAMSLELPILSTKHAGIPEMVIDGVNGILCEERNIEQYVQAFEKIIEWGICPQNRERVINHFSIRSHMKELSEIYASMLN